MEKANHSETKSKKLRSDCRYTLKLGEDICRQVESGDNLCAIARQMGMHHASIHRWVKRYASFRARYTQACELRLCYMEERLADLCSEAHQAALEEQTGRLRIDAIKLEIDTLKWQLSKLMPHRYGDKSQLELTGKDGRDLLPKHTREEDMAYLTMLAEIQAKTPPPKPMEAT